MKYFIGIIFIAVVVHGQPSSSQEDSKEDEYCKQPPPRIDPINCCKFPDMANHEVFQKCEQEHPSKGNAGHLPDMKFCAAECAFKEVNILKGDDLDKEAALSYIQSTLGADSQVFLPIMQRAVENCSAEHATMKEKFGDKMEKMDEAHKPECNPVPSFYLMCVKRNVFNNCPADRWTASNECNQLKEFSTRCHHHHGHHPRPRPGN